MTVLNRNNMMMCMCKMMRQLIAVPSVGACL